MEIPSLGVQLELQLPAYTTATAMQDPSCVCSLHHSSRILDPLSEARGQTCVLMDASWVPYCCATTGTPHLTFLMALPHDTRAHKCPLAWPLAWVVLALGRALCPVQGGSLCLQGR